MNMLIKFRRSKISYVQESSRAKLNKFYKIIANFVIILYKVDIL